MQTRRIADNQTKLLRRQKVSARINGNKALKNNQNISKLNDRVTDLENDLGFLALLVSGIVNKLDENGSVNKNELQNIIKEIDGLDGIEDGKLDIKVLRGLSH